MMKPIHLKQQTAKNLSKKYLSIKYQGLAMKPNSYNSPPYHPTPCFLSGRGSREISRLAVMLPFYAAFIRKASSPRPILKILVAPTMTLTSMTSSLL